MKELVILVERAVRPVRAGPARKLRMREELLAHLTGIFEEEKARLGDAAAARAEAARRFGDPAGLTAELEESLTAGDRVGAFLDRAFGWRPPESAARYSLRLATTAFVLLLPVALVAARPLVVRGPGAPPLDRDAVLTIRGFFALLAVGSVDVFLFGWLYYRMRDALHGTPWAPKSLGRVAASAGFLALVVPVSAVVLELGKTLDPRATFAVVDWLGVGVVCLMGAVAAGFTAWLAHREGPGEIKHTVWSCLDIGG